MKLVVLKSTRPLLLLVLAGLPLALRSQATGSPPPTAAAPWTIAPSAAADQAWAALLAENKAADDAMFAGNAAGKSRADFANHGKSAAERARKFYTKHPDHPQAAEARKLEVFSLIEAVENDDPSEGRRLDGLVDTLRKDSATPVKTRAQVAAAYDFTKALHTLKARGDRMEATAATARKLAREFPEEPQAYEALLAVARASDQEKAGQIAYEVVASRAPEHLKQAAQTLLDRHALVGRSLATVLGDDGAALVASLPPATPVIVYSWATWGPGSLELGRMIQARRFAAVGVCLDENTAEAGKVERQAGLGGKHAYDAKGLGGTLADRLKFSTAGQVYLVDAGGVIRDVRGGDGLEAKLTSLGFSTPALIVPSITELLRR